MAIRTDGECAGRRVNGRINDIDLAGKHLVAVDIEGEVYVHAFLYLGEERLRDVDLHLDRADFLYHKNRAGAAVHVAAVVVALRHDAADRTDETRVLGKVFIVAARDVVCHLFGVPFRL